VASAGGDVRVIWSNRRKSGTLVGVCPVPNSCYWSEPTTPEFSGAVWVSTADGGERTLVTDAFSLVNGNATLDKVGRVHLVGYAFDPAEYEYGLTYPAYVVFGPSTQ
jgi:hypothetical protein